MSNINLTVQSYWVVLSEEHTFPWWELVQKPAKCFLAVRRVVYCWIANRKARTFLCVVVAAAQSLPTRAGKPMKEAGGWNQSGGEGQIWAGGTGWCALCLSPATAASLPPSLRWTWASKIVSAGLRRSSAEQEAYARVKGFKSSFPSAASWSATPTPIQQGKGRIGLDRQFLAFKR